MPSLEHDRWLDRIERALRDLKSPAKNPASTWTKRPSRNDVDAAPLDEFDSTEFHHTVARGDAA